MEQVKKWYKESEKTLKVFTTADYNFILYKGFKISSYPDDYYRIEDVRHNDFYSKLTKPDLLILEKEGFIRGSDIIMHNRDLRRIKILEKKIEKLYSDKDRFKSLLSRDETFYSKRIKNCDEAIETTSNLLFLFKIREKQFKK